MGFALKLDSYLVDHLQVFGIILYATLAFILVLFVANAVHAWRGTRYPFVMWMDITTIADVFVYAAYSYYKIYKED